MGNNGKVERIEKAFKYLQYKGLVQDKKNLAIKMNRNTSSISRVFSGDEKYLTDKFFIKFCHTFNDIINKDWLITGEGEMLRDQYITITNARTRTREEDEGDKHKEIVFRPVVTKQLATQSDTDVYSVIKEDKTLKLQYIPAIPPYTSIDFYYTIRQDAMLPEYKLGEVLALEHMKSNSDIVQGAAMVVDTSDFGFLFRRIYDRGDYYECRRINENSVFENQNVPKSKVIRLYRVIYSMKFGD